MFNKSLTAFPGHQACTWPSPVDTCPPLQVNLCPLAPQVFGQPVSLFLGSLHALWWSPPWPLTCPNSSLMFIDFTASSDTFFFETIQFFSLTIGLLAFLLPIIHSFSDFFSVYFSVCPLNTAVFPSSALDFHTPYSIDSPLATTFLPTVSTTFCMWKPRTFLGIYNSMGMSYTFLSVSETNLFFTCKSTFS